jgi:sporulation protein YlmC with PRC-barrel domain
MRLSELLGLDVFDRTGVSVGSVIDVRLVQDGPPQALGQARLRVAGLVVSPRHSGRLLGYERTPKEGPWLIRQLVTAYHRGARYVPWEWVEGYDAHSARLDRPATELPELGDLPVR